jgi:23S rRNA pseudouridine1911/1915/1917 synthase
MPKHTQIKHVVTVPEYLHGARLDFALAKLLPEYSRGKLQRWIEAEHVRVDGEVGTNRVEKVVAESVITLETELEVVEPCAPEAIRLAIVYEDDDLLVINKPVGLVVHPGAGNPRGTLVNALLHYCPVLNQLPRAGLVHRLDKDTSGLLVIAKTIATHTRLVRMMQSRKISREYIALVEGKLIAGGTIDQPVGRHPKHRTKMAVIDSGKDAITHYRVLERFRAHTLLKVMLETGRTHQIRVHLAWAHYPLVGDSFYGWRLRLPPKAKPVLIEGLQAFKRQALHATRLSLNHPQTGELLEWEAPLPEDMQHLIALLREDTQAND